QTRPAGQAGPPFAQFADEAGPDVSEPHATRKSATAHSRPTAVRTSHPACVCLERSSAPQGWQWIQFAYMRTVPRTSLLQTGGDTPPRRVHKRNVRTQRAAGPGDHWKPSCRILIDDYFIHVY